MPVAATVAGMSYDLSTESWGVVRSFLPADWKQSARKFGAIRRAREIKDEEVLLQLLLMHTAGGLSLKQTAMRATESGLAEVSAVALFKRLRAAEPWLRHLTAQMVEEMSTKLTQMGEPGRRWRIMDATDIVEPGPTGTSWRVHYSLRLPELACDFFEVTDAHGGESFKRLPVKSGDVVLADRGYAKRQGVAHILATGADVVVRINLQTFPLSKSDDGEFKLLPCLRRLKGQACGEWQACFEWKGRRYPVRLCAVRKSAINAERARRKAKRKSRNNGYQAIQPEPWNSLDIFLCSQHWRQPITLPKPSWRYTAAGGRLNSPSNDSSVSSRLGMSPKPTPIPAVGGCKGKSSQLCS